MKNFNLNPLSAAYKGANSVAKYEDSERVAASSKCISQQKQVKVGTEM
jgi:hypothetical protein